MFYRRFPTVVVLLVLSAQPVLAYPGKVVHSFGTPGRFCTGVAFDGQSLWVADYKADMLFQVDARTGRTLRAIPSPGFWPMGLAWDGEHLWNADKGRKKIFEVDPVDGTVLKTLDAPSENPEGLAWDGKTLWVSDSKSREIMQIDLSDGTAVKTLTAPAQAANGLAFDGAYLWCSDRMTDEIYMVDPNSGEVLVILDAPGPYPHGIAWDGQCLWAVDQQKDTLYRLVRWDGELYRLKNTRKARVTFTHEVKSFGSGKIGTLQVCLAVPETMPQQKIESLSFSPSTCTMHKDRWQQEAAVFQYEAVPAGMTVESRFEADVTISDIRYFIFPDRCGTLADIPAEIRDRYTANGTKYMTDDPYIRKIAREVAGDQKSPYAIARKMYDYVRNHLEYKLEGGWNAAPVVLRRGTGSCSEYSFCFIALCRAAGVPARYVGSVVVRGDDASLDDTFHRWPEVYLPNYGWVTMDAQGGDKPLPRDRAMHIGNLSNRFLITTQGGGDSEYLGWYYDCYETYTCDPQLEIRIEAFAEWEPLEEKEEPR
ncbi:MAG: transglutaminase [Phycisphaerae bacterium]|nr:transglutaminase [Phycisphaerae bacterium]